RLVNVDEVQLHGAEQFLDSAGHVDRKRRSAAAGAAWGVEDLAHGDHAGLASVGSLPQARRPRPRRPPRPARGPQPRPRARGGARTPTLAARRESSEDTRAMKAFTSFSCASQG